MSSKTNAALSSAIMLWVWAAGVLLAGIVVLLLRRHPLTWNPELLGLTVIGLVSGGGAVLVWNYRARLGPVPLTSVAGVVLTAVMAGAIAAVLDASFWWRDGLFALAFFWPLTAAVEGVRKGRISDDAA